MTFDVRRLTDLVPLAAFLGRDRALTAYALADLDDAFWPQSEFYGAQVAGELAAVVLLYHGLEPSVLTAFGDLAGVRAIFETVALPPRIYYLMLPALAPMLADIYELPHQRREARMVLSPTEFRPASGTAVARIQAGQTAALEGLYRHALPDEQVVAFSPWQVAHGIFYGVWQGGELVAAAGTHVWSVAQGITAIGNVFTRPDARGRGYAARCTSAVVRDALAAGIATVVLNVRDDNHAAIRVYQRLGFQPYATFVEGPGLRRVGAPERMGDNRR